MRKDDLLSTITRREGTDIHGTELVKYFWKEKTKILIALILGGIFSGFFCYVTREPEFVSKFLVQIDSESLPAITEAEQLIPALNKVVQSTFSQSIVLREIFENQRELRQDQKDRITKHILSEIDLFVEGMPLNKNVRVSPPRNSSPILEVIPGTREGSFITVVRLPESGFTDTLGHSVVKALNKSIESTNTDHYNIQIQKLKYQIEDSNHYANLTRGGINLDRNGIENDLIKIKSEIAILEFALSKIAIGLPTIQQYINFAKSGGSFGSPLIFDQKKDKQPVLDEVGLNTKTDFILRLISALRAERKISQEYAKKMEDKLAQLNTSFRKYSSDKSLILSFEDNISQRISEEIKTNEFIDRSKVLLPRLKLDEEFYLTLKSQAARIQESVPLEKSEFDRKMKPFVIVGSLLGFLISMSLLALSFVFKIEFRRFNPLPEAESMGHRRVSELS